MTEEQIRITKHVATQVMEWKSDGKPLDDEHPWFQIDYTGLVVYWMPGSNGKVFSPTESISDAFIAVEKMRERGFWLKLTGPFSPKDERESMRLWNAGLTEHGFTGWNSRPPFRGKHAEAPMAICLALVAATGGS